MSRSLAAVVLAGLALFGAAPASAQGAPAGPTAEEAAAAQKRVYGPADPRAACGVADAQGDIVVCAASDKEFRVMSSADLDPTGHEATYDGLPRAPQLDKGSCKGQANCVSFGYAPPPVYYIDLKAIPEAPEGSDADKVAKGEMPDR